MDARNILIRRRRWRRRRRKSRRGSKRGRKIQGGSEA
jgi:hypothetical protein